MKRVVLFSGELSLRGSSLYTVTLAGGLKQRGHRVAVLGPGGLLEDVLAEHRITRLELPVHARWWRDLLYLRNYVETVRAFGAEVLHIQHQDLTALGAMVATRLEIPAILTVHGQVTDALHFPLAEPPRVIAVSENVRQSLVTAGHVDRERIEVVPNGVSPSLSALEDRDGERSDVPVVGTVNRLAPDRGVDVFLRAARRVLDQGTKARFLVVGSGPEESRLRKLARDLGLTESLTFALPRTRVAGLFRPIDLFVSAARTEGHGIFLLSAMAEARPVIATGVGGVLSFLRDGENGLLVPRGDVEALATAISDLLGDDERRDQLAREGFRNVRERFPLHTMVERTAAIYEQA